MFTVSNWHASKVQTETASATVGCDRDQQSFSHILARRRARKSDAQTRRIQQLAANPQLPVQLAAQLSHFAYIAALSGGVAKFWGVFKIPSTTELFQPKDFEFMFEFDNSPGPVN